MSVEWDDLVDKQKLVADAENPTFLVFGSAGTGKTTTALWAARREIDRRDAAGQSPAARVLFLTFSRTAVGRVLERAASVLPGEYRDRVEVMTFHGFGWWLAQTFGRYHGLGDGQPVLCSSAEARLLGITGQARLGYDHLLPMALDMLRSRLIGGLLSSRWTLIVCDEFQDTSDDQWTLLELLGASARLLLLADANQMIYQWLPGVGPHRLAVARQRDGCVEETLPAQSHRDPSQVIPAAAEAFLTGHYDDDALRSAVGQGRLRVVAPVPTASSADYVADEIAYLREAGHQSIGVFVSRNDYVGELCRDLASKGIIHTPVGLGEALSSALAAQVAIVAACLGEADWNSVCRALAIYLTSLQRSGVPEGARLLLQGQVFSGQQRLLDGLREEISREHDLRSSAELAATAWPRLSFETLAGDANWRHAATELRPLIGAALRAPAQSRVAALLQGMDGVRSASLVAMEEIRPSVVQVMTLAQTKGREVDATIALARDDDWFGQPADWQQNMPRLIYVVLTRARSTAVVMLPSTPHGAFAPLMRFASPPE
jgi:DNA helicase II / ATP-dependent DNA helicase PcrA